MRRRLASIELLNQRDAATWVREAKCGDFEAAWSTSDRILARHIAHPRADLPRHLQSVWNGTALHGQRVLVRCYHGLGDSVQFIRYVGLARSIAREVTVWAQAALVPLFRTVAGIDRLLPLHDGVPEVDYDVDVEVMELPFVFRTTLSTIPASVPYLTATPASFDDGFGLRVGIVWRAGDWDTRRSIPFEALDQLLNVPGPRWYQLQFGVKPHERHPRLAMTYDTTLLELACLMRGLDLVISIDSLPAHLAGALAVPIWTLLPHDADWRWLEHRCDSPWYPTMRLFRQPALGDWHAVIREVREALDTWCATAESNRRTHA
jgi:hypothetical protein